LKNMKISSISATRTALPPLGLLMRRNAKDLSLDDHAVFRALNLPLNPEYCVVILSSDVHSSFVLMIQHLSFDCINVVLHHCLRVTSILSTIINGSIEMYC
jgi:hypothetical protein